MFNCKSDNSNFFIIKKIYIMDKSFLQHYKIPTNSSDDSKFIVPLIITIPLGFASWNS